MHSAIHDTFGEPADVLHLADSVKPQAKQGEALIRMVLSPIHNHDLWTVRGNYGYKPDLPAIGGTEALGVVEAVGEGVDAGMIRQWRCRQDFRRFGPCARYPHAEPRAPRRCQGRTGRAGDPKCALHR